MLRRIINKTLSSIYTQNRFVFVFFTFSKNCSLLFSSTLTSTEFQRQMKNEPVLEYRKGSSERKQLEEAIKKYANVTTKVPCVIGGKEVDSKDVQYQLSVRLLYFSHLVESVLC